MNIKANLVDLHQKTIYPASITIENGIIASIERLSEDLESYILPGFIDAHIHIESSLLVPSEFARMAVLHGTVATVSDPHEIANVCGVKGVEYMIDNSKRFLSISSLELQVVFLLLYMRLQEQPLNPRK